MGDTVERVNGINTVVMRVRALGRYDARTWAKGLVAAGAARGVEVVAAMGA